MSHLQRFSVTRTFPEAISGTEEVYEPRYTSKIILIKPDRYIALTVLTERSSTYVESMTCWYFFLIEVLGHTDI